MSHFLVTGFLVVAGLAGCVVVDGGAGERGGSGGAGGGGGTGGTSGTEPLAPGRYQPNGSGTPPGEMSMTCQPQAPDCSALWDANSGAATCAPLSQVETFASGRLAGLWQTAPTSECAYSMQSTNACGMLGPQNAFYCPGDNSISWDYDFLSQQSAEHGDFAPVVILAHEWGHRNQEILGLLGARAQVMNELHADCQAGIFAAVEEASGNLQMGDVESGWSSLCAAGGTASWFDPAGHGSCQERVDAFHWGYVSARSHLSDLCGGCAFEAMTTICAN